ncbi:NADH-flavin reductase [Lysinibacillus sp. KCTC 33748]|uniref:NAD(P)-dependent oxidoreductase n=1 Tax=unclassified Lysinibacillus TaxID=2636778 RepID=UPI0009A79F78|nr:MULTISPECIES: NAD(P)H-binding protein [unclassified Lysinibacillus]OXS73812.1 NADH-flavin reductase [Lysinibacillus sp. KCTC 33748]SKB76704.1 Putative NADH-flavin reductase [Lysinibacillus sp. AC-3]
MDSTSRIAIIGGTGKVGRHIAARAIEKGYHVRMLVRNPDKVLYKNDKIEIVKGQVQEIESIRELLKDCQVVINTFGQPPKEEPIYSKVTATIFNVMKDLNISRYIGVSGGSLTIKEDKKSMMNRFGAKMFEVLFPKMMKDKKLEWELLLNSKQIKWTLLRLPFVKDSLTSNQIKENLTDMPGTKITNQDIATFIIDHIDNEKYVHKTPFISH